MKNLLKRFVKDESGATAIEYGLIAGLLSIVIIGAVTLTGGSLTDVFTSISTQLDSAVATTGGGGDATGGDATGG
ncbi:Flp family type IVb pilin [Roseibium marinum]|uniref:Pilus assembly protein Flp/PilA n=1 Tax=Roseibium marinum TaxID=281252 RepID=A0A2S3V3A6_9HYPH|nr:Flp family type IVb pilin [Roseibium marinum]POF34441.1 pilus assembly protein Flp/PilA [Roseibium marinum]